MVSLFLSSSGGRSGWEDSETNGFPPYRSPDRMLLVIACPNCRAFRRISSGLFGTPAASMDGASALVSALVSAPFTFSASFKGESPAQRVPWMSMIRLLTKWSNVRANFNSSLRGLWSEPAVRDFQLIPARAEEGAQAGVALDDIAVVVHLLDASRRGARGGVAKLQLGLSAGRESAFGGSPPCLPGWRRGRTRTGACSTPH